MKPAAPPSTASPHALAPSPAGGEGERTIGVYVHIPFCERRCPYCDFVTTDREDLHRRFRAVYVDTLRREWALWRAAHPVIAGMRLASVYFGGGTPNLLAPEELAPLIRDITGGVGEVEADVEITAEMNPGLSGEEALRRWRAVGVNRVSLGVQSTEDRLLEVLGRQHSAAAARQAFAWARAADFTNIGVDLIFAIPGQMLADWDRTLGEVLAWGPDHVSTYNLTAKDQTPLAARVRSGEIALPDEETQFAMFLRAHAVLSDGGLTHYEIANFARPGHACRHNSDVWRGRPYIGLGLGAHSFFAGERSWNTAVWEDYHSAVAAGRLPRCPDATRDAAGARAEALYLGLRTCEGIALDGLPPAKVEALCEEGLAVIDAGRLRLTVQGWAVADAVVAQFL